MSRRVVLLCVASVAIRVARRLPDRATNYLVIPGLLEVFT